MKLGRLNHIGVTTPSIADSIVFYRNVMGATKIHAPFDLPEQGVKVCFVDTPGADGAMNGTQIELIESRHFWRKIRRVGSIMSVTKCPIFMPQRLSLRQWANACLASHGLARMGRSYSLYIPRICRVF
jgi:hypothetical protein